MSSNRYKIIISNNNLYKEIELSPDITMVKVGTGIDCSYRLLKDLFFEAIELTFQKANDSWCVVCSDNLYISTGDIRKLMRKDLSHGEIVEVRYQGSNTTVFSVEFLLDFGGNRKYERLLHTEQLHEIAIGTDPSYTVVLNSAFVSNDAVILAKKQGGYDVRVIRSKYGVYINDKKIQGSDTLRMGDFMSISDYTFYLSEIGIWTEIRSDMHINNLTFEDRPNPNGYPKFVRNVRMHSKLNEEPIEILDPASKPEKPKNNLFMSLLPSMGMLLTSGAMAMMGGGGMIAFSVLSGAMAILTAVLGFVDNKKDYKKSVEKRIDEYNRYIENKRAEIAQFRDGEKRQLEGLYLDVPTERSLVQSFSSDLFDRQPEDEDFLFVRLGTGAIEAKRLVEYKKQEKLEVEDDLQQMPQQIKRETLYLNEAPVVCDFRDASAVAMIGPEGFRFGLFKNIILDICVRQYYSDVEMIFVAEESNKNKITWLRFLPEVNNDQTGMRNIVCDDESKNRMFDYLYKELTFREGQSSNGSSSDNKHPFKHILVFFYDEYGFQRHPLSKFVAKGKDLGITFIFMVDNRSCVPVGCTYTIDVVSEREGCITEVANRESYRNFSFNAVSDGEIRGIVNYLAPVFTEEISLEGSLTKNISMFEMMNILMAEDIDLEDRWAKSLVYKSMAAPIGVTKNSYVYLDLHDKAHGPHGLVAGTTGSGKSEILQTYILSIATLFHPYEVSFVIIDFKGGGMVNQFKDLPHLVGAITNIDGKEIDRSLKSIKAELQKRQRLFAEADVNHIDKYIKKFKAGEVKQPIPHLVLIVDEFAELKAEQPDFMKELISAARIGRSLGVHLILATQKPSGQVDDQIWSNSRFKLCLKVQSVEDSNEVLKSPLAAEIKEPGRAYLQVGNNEIFELFQSAYSGAPEKMTDSNVKEFSIMQISETGKRKVLYQQKKKKNNENNLTQLDAIVRLVHDYCEQKSIAQLPSICLPSLLPVIPHPEAAAVRGGLIDIGIFDDPDSQVQDSTWLDINNRNTLIIGSSQYGKTNLLQSLIKSVCLTQDASQAVFYILDFGSMVLKNFESLNHVGGVVTSSEDEKLKNLFKLLFEEIASRKERLVSVGVSSFSSYLEAGYTDLPHIYVIVDNLTALYELYLENDDSLLMIIRDGVSVGITAIVANAQTAGIGYKYISNFANKICLYCNDGNEYSNVFDHVSVKPDEKPGRCILEIDKRMLECQTYIAFDGEKEIDRVNKIRTFVDQANAASVGKRAKMIPCIPNLLTQESLYTDFGAEHNGYVVPIGLTYSDVKPFCLNLMQMGVWGICGKEGMGHRNLVTYLVSQLNTSQYNKANVVVFDDISRKYAFLKDKVSRYSLGTDAVHGVIREWHAELEKRYDRLLLEETPAEPDELLLMIIQNNDVASKIQEDMEINDMFTDIVSRYKDFGVCIIFANYPNAGISYDAPDSLRTVKQDRHMIYLDDLSNLKCFDVAYEALREYKKPVSVGDGYYINDNEVTKLKLVMAE